MTHFLRIFLFLLLSQHVFAYKAQKDTLLMGSAFQFAAIHTDANRAETALRNAIDEVVRIEALISSWDERSETSMINRNAGVKPVHVSLELYQLIERCMKVSELTDGVFDISFSSLKKVWRFDGTQTDLPDSLEISESVALIDYRNIVLNKDDTSVFLKKAGMKIGFGAIGKGYAADCAIEIIKRIGVQHALVNAGGDLRAIGKNDNGEAWKVGIADPQDKSKILSWLKVDDQAVVTSGNYEKYIEVNGIKYCHIIHPKTGWPVHGLQSVTVICPSGELSDALATSVFIMGAEKGIELINRIEGVECFVITDSGEMKSSANLNLNFYK